MRHRLVSRVLINNHIELIIFHLISSLRSHSRARNLHPYVHAARLIYSIVLVSTRVHCHLVRFLIECGQNVLYHIISLLTTLLVYSIIFYSTRTLCSLMRTFSYQFTVSTSTPHDLFTQLYSSTRIHYWRTISQKSTSAPANDFSLFINITYFVDSSLHHQLIGKLIDVATWMSCSRRCQFLFVDCLSNILCCCARSSGHQMSQLSLFPLERTTYF